jgi:hypothetical protein
MACAALLQAHLDLGRFTLAGLRTHRTLQPIALIVRQEAVRSGLQADTEFALVVARDADARVDFAYGPGARFAAESRWALHAGFRFSF